MAVAVQWGGVQEVQSTVQGVVDRGDEAFVVRAGRSEQSPAAAEAESRYFNIGLSK